jgi:CBS domain-containing protein
VAGSVERNGFNDQPLRSRSSSGTTGRNVDIRREANQSGGHREVTVVVRAPIVRDVMKKPGRTFAKDQAMLEAAIFVARSPIAAVPVIDENGNVVGLLSEKDCLRAVGQWAYEGVAGGAVGDYMSDLSHRLTPQMDLLSASLAFVECNFSCLPVMDGDQVVGRLVRHELLTAIERWAGEVNQEIKDRVTATSDHERPSAISHMLKVVGSHTRQQISQVFKKN